MDEPKIRKLALVNALEHGGKAEANSVLGKIISEHPEAKQRIRELIPQIQSMVAEVNSLSEAEQRSAVAAAGGMPVEQKREEEHVLPELPGAVKGKVVTAFPPEPSKYPHMGHAKSALVNFMYAQKYKGRFLLRFEDSNPDVARKEYYKAILDGLRWLGIKWDSLDYLSDHMPEYYSIVERFIANDEAYVCTCEQEEIKRRRSEGLECEHRSQVPKTNMEMWRAMLKSTKAGGATVRMKMDMSNQNAAMRDPSIARIIDKPHVRTKRRYRVWPMYDLGTSMLDAWEKVTHRVRTKEFELRKDLQDGIIKAAGFKPPYITEIGRFQIKDAITQGREIRDGIERKVFSGWDDPRLSTLAALRRRGFAPEAIKEFLMSTGVTKNESVYDWQSIESFNRKFVDPTSDRYFAVLDPEKTKLEGMPVPNAISVQTRPGSKKSRKIILKSDTIYVDKEDHRSLAGQSVGLMFLCTANFGPVKRFVSKDVSHETPKIHWVGEPNVKISVVMPDGSVKKGVGEPGLKKLKVGQVVQLYRVGFCRVDKTGKEVSLYFTHK